MKLVDVAHTHTVDTWKCNDIEIVRVTDFQMLLYTLIWSFERSLVEIHIPVLRWKCEMVQNMETCTMGLDKFYACWYSWNPGQMICMLVLLGGRPNCEGQLLKPWTGF